MHGQRWWRLGAARRRWAGAGTRSCSTQLTKGSDLDLRVTVLTALTKLHHGSEDPRVGRVLSAIALDAAQPKAIRLFAYQSLFRLAGQFLSLQDENRISEGTLRVPEDFDLRVFYEPRD